jgi:hypothetical protein
MALEFPCDVDGCVELDALSDRTRIDYLRHERWSAASSVARLSCRPASVDSPSAGRAGPPFVQQFCGVFRCDPAARDGADCARILQAAAEVHSPSTCLPASMPTRCLGDVTALRLAFGRFRLHDPGGL